MKKSTGDIVTDLQYRIIPNNEHVIPRCVTNLNQECYLPILNCSDQDICCEKGKVVVSGYTCHEKVENFIPMLSAEVTKFRQFTIHDIQTQINPKLADTRISRLLSLLNEYRDCFAISTSEIGKTNTAEMTISLTDDIPIVYRPYRMGFKEREVVGGVVNDLMEKGIIRDSCSPYASPVPLVRKKNSEPPIYILTIGR